MPETEKLQKDPNVLALGGLSSLGNLASGRARIRAEDADACGQSNQTLTPGLDRRTIDGTVDKLLAKRRTLGGKIAEIDCLLQHIHTNREETNRAVEFNREVERLLGDN